LHCKDTKNLTRRPPPPPNFPSKSTKSFTYTHHPSLIRNSDLLDDINPTAITQGLWDKFKEFVSTIAKKSGILDFTKNLLALLKTLGNTVLKVAEGPDMVTVDPDLSDWMGSTYPPGKMNVKICNISMMGTHDTFTYTMSGILGAVTGKTQKYDIPTQ